MRRGKTQWGTLAVHASLRAALTAAIIGSGALRCFANDFTKIHGRLGLGANFGGRGRPNLPYEAVVKLTHSTSRSTRARIEAGADHEDLELAVKDGFLEIRERCASQRFRAGRDRKVLGWHYEQAHAERLGIDLDPPNAFLNERAFTTRDYFASWDWRSVAAECDTASDTDDTDQPGDVLTGNPRVQAGISAFFGQTNDYSLMAHGLFRVGQAWRFGAWATGETRGTKDSNRPLFVWATALGVLYQEHVHRVELEGWVGVDPYASEIARLRDAPKVFFSAAVIRYAIFLGPWNPYATASYLAKNLSFQSRTAAGTIGLRYFFEPRLSLAAEVTHESWRGIGYSPGEIRGQLFGRYFF